MLPRPGVSKGSLQAQSAEVWRSQRGILQTQKPNKATDGLAPSVLDCFRVQHGRPRTSFRQRVRKTRGEKPRVRTSIMLPRPDVPARGHYRLEEPRSGVPRRAHCGPKCSTRLPTECQLRFFYHFSSAVTADSRIFPPTSKEGPRRETADSRRAPEDWFPGRGHCSSKFQHCLTLLSNAPEAKWCCSGSPHPTFHRGSVHRLFVVYDVSYS